MNLTERGDVVVLVYMEPQTQEVVYRELQQIDEALHRLKSRLLSSVRREDVRRDVFLRTGGILAKKYTKKDIIAWQRKMRDEWEQ